MANHKSAEKRARQDVKRREYNKSIKSRVKTSVKSVLASVNDKNGEAAQARLADTIKVIDKAAAKNVFHKNAAARKVSRLTKKVNALSSD